MVDSKPKSRKRLSRDVVTIVLSLPNFMDVWQQVDFEYSDDPAMRRINLKVAIRESFGDQYANNSEPILSSAISSGPHQQKIIDMTFEDLERLMNHGGGSIQCQWFNVAGSQNCQEDVAMRAETEGQSKKSTPSNESM